MDPTRIGVVEDDAQLGSVLQRALTREGFTVLLAATGHEAIERFAAAPPDALILDIGLPDADGRDVCQALRVRGVESPVIFLTARDALPDRLSGFSVGADDYITKPFAVVELVARLRVALRRRGEPSRPSELGFEVDPGAHAARAGDQTVKLTPTEFRLLSALAAAPGVVVRRHELRAAAWPEGAIVHDNTIDAYIARLRRKLGTIRAGHSIETLRGVGYVLR